VIFPPSLIPNPAQIMSAIRWAVTTGGTLMAANGASSSKIETVSGIILAIAPFAVSMFVHTDANAVKVASAVQGIGAPIRIAPDAPAALQALAKDDSVPNVQPLVEPPAPPSPYATTRTRN
jgi:hypothetical protein